jgi:hypothetical protein
MLLRAFIFYNGALHPFSCRSNSWDTKFSKTAACYTSHKLRDGLNILPPSGVYRYTFDDSGVLLRMTFAHHPQEVLNTFLRPFRSGN